MAIVETIVFTVAASALKRTLKLRFDDYADPNNLVEGVAADSAEDLVITAALTGGVWVIKEIVRLNDSTQPHQYHMNGIPNFFIEAKYRCKKCRGHGCYWVPCPSCSEESWIKRTFFTFDCPFCSGGIMKEECEKCEATGRTDKDEKKGTSGFHW